MSESISDWLLGLIGVAMLAAVAGFFAPKGAMARVLKLIGGVAMTAALLAPLLDFDYASYAAALQRYDVDAVWDAEAAAQTENRLNRLVIEDACGAYILDKAAQLGVPLSGVEVTVQWSAADGVWYPDTATLRLPAGGAPSAALENAIESDLGIPAECQKWSEDAQANG